MRKSKAKKSFSNLVKFLQLVNGRDRPISISSQRLWSWKRTEAGPMAKLANEIIFQFGIITAGSQVSTPRNLMLSCQGDEAAMNLASTLNTSMQVPAQLPWLPPAPPGKTFYFFSYKLWDNYYYVYFKDEVNKSQGIKEYW